MPKYITKREEIPTEHEFEQMLAHTKDVDESRLLLALWLTGARPGELFKITGRDCIADEKSLRIRAPTEKRGTSKEFDLNERVLEWARGNKWVETFVPLLPQNPEQFLFWGTEPTRPKLATLERRAQRIVAKLSAIHIGRSISPYHFRHGLLTNMGEAKNERGEYMFSIFDLKAWKGAKTAASVEGYVHARAPKLNMGSINRTRKLE